MAVVASDDFPGVVSLDSPFYTGVQAVTPSDTDDLTKVSRAIYIGTTGNLSALMRDGTTLTWASIPVGWYPLRIRRINSTGTTASAIKAFF
jgi:hypothetical protein